MIRKYAEIFCWKNVSSFCSAKATHIFSAKNIRILYIESAKTVNEMTLNELVKLTMLWTTGPWTLKKKKKKKKKNFPFVLFWPWKFHNYNNKCLYFHINYLFQPLYEAQNLKSPNRFSSSSGTSQGSGDQIFYNRAPPGGQQQQGMSSISNNLTELDQLLSDLNSAQFLAEVDKKHPPAGKRKVWRYTRKLL